MSSLPSLSTDEEVQFSELLLRYHMLQPPTIYGLTLDLPKWKHKENEWKTNLTAFSVS